MPVDHMGTADWDALARAASDALSAHRRKSDASAYLRADLAKLCRYLAIRAFGDAPPRVSDDADAVAVAESVLDAGETGLLARLKALAQRHHAEADRIWQAVTALEAVLQSRDWWR